MNALIMVLICILRNIMNSVRIQIKLEDH